GATLQIASGGLQSVTSNDGMDLLLHVDENIITIKDGWRYLDSSSSGMLKIVDAAGNDLLSSITPVRFAGRNTPYGYSSSPNVSVVGSDDDDYIGNSYNGKNVTVHAGDGDDTISNDGSNVTIDAGNGNDQISNSGSTISINAGDGNDTISNIGSNVTINAGKGDDYITSNSLIVYNEGDGNDTIYASNYGGATLQIASGDLQSVTSNDGWSLLLHVGDNIITIADGWRYLDSSSSGMLKIVDAAGNNLLSSITPVFFVNGYNGYNGNSVPNVSVVGSDGDDYITNSGGTNVTITAGAGDDSISLGYGYSTLNNVIVYNKGDGDDTVTGFDATSTLQIVGTYFTQQSGSDIIVTVGDGSVLLKGAASLSVVNITGGDEIPAPSDWTITDGVASYKTLFTITGLKAGVTVDDIEANVSIGGATVTVNENVLGDDEVTISDGYTLALARTVELSEEIPAKWNVNGTTATYTGEHVTAGYAVVDGTIIHRDATDTKTFTLTGIKRNLTESALNENVTIDDTTVTLNENVLNNTTVTISDGFTLALADTVELSETADANWDINSAGDTSTAIYISGGTTAGYALDDNKIVYNDTTGGTFTLTGLSKTFSADDLSIDGNKIILTADALNQTTVTLTTTGNYSLALGDDCPTVTTVAKSWTLDGTTATYHDAGKSDGYTLTDSKTVTYTTATGGNVLLTVNGVVENISEDDLSENLTVSGKVLTVTPEVVGENFSVSGGYKVVFSEGNYGNSSFTGTDGKDTIEVNGNGLQISLGAGNDTITSNGDGNVYLFDANGGKDVVKGFGNDDTIKITDGSAVTASVKNSDIIVKAGSATMTLKNAATGTHLNVVDSAGETLIDETVYSDRIVVDDGATLLSAFSSSSFAAEDPIVKVDGSAVTRKFSLTGGEDNNTLIGGTGANFINGVSGENILTGGKGNDTFVAGNGNDTITDYGVGTDKISLAADISDFSVEGDDVIISFDDDKSVTIADGAGKKIYFLQNGKSSTEIFDAGGKMNTAKTSITLNSATDDYTAASTIVTIDGSLTEGVNIVGNAKNNKIFGSDGDDTLNGGTKNATITGGGGEDIFVYESGKVVITDYVSGDDRISLTASPTSESLKSNGDVVLKFDSTNQLTIKGGDEIVFVTDSGEVTKTYFSEKIVGDDGVTLTSSFTGNFTADGKVDASANAKKITLTGGDNSDTLIGGKGTNVIDGNGGDDILIGNGGADTFVYSSGDDTITDYGNGSDKISLTSAIADFTVDNDDVIISFGDGSLTISDAANSAISFVETTNGKVTTNVNIFAENGIFNKLKTAVTLKADASSYTATTNIVSIDGGLATDAIEIVGNSKANKIYAGDNGSTIDGGSNNDSLWGGNGNDTFIYSGGNDVVYGFGDGDALNFNGDFTASVKGNSIAFKVGSTANAVTLKDFTAEEFNVNGDTYEISNGTFTRK
ncbi:MAG: hypothetical protein IJ774_09700, partial [Selenomonadaceae bacterium]|nr:hypothetical protein [Selenomonadaceae bacterium]